MALASELIQEIRTEVGRNGQNGRLAQGSAVVDVNRGRAPVTVATALPIVMDQVSWKEFAIYSLVKEPGIAGRNGLLAPSLVAKGRGRVGALVPSKMVANRTAVTIWTSKAVSVLLK